MNSFKSIAALSLAVSSSSAFALYLPPRATKTACLAQYQLNDGSTVASVCDESANNKQLGKELLANGCAEGQTAITVSRWEEKEPFEPNIRNCLPPNVAQL